MEDQSMVKLTLRQRSEKAEAALVSQTREQTVITLTDAEYNGIVKRNLIQQERIRELEEEQNRLRLIVAPKNRRIRELEAALRAVFKNREVWTSDEWDSMERKYGSQSSGGSEHG